MYWVRMVDEIALIRNAPSESISGIFMMESLYGSIDFKEYAYAGQSCEALDTQRMIGEHPGSGGDTVLMIAADGLVKNETLDDFLRGAIDMTGEERPAFVSDELPVGMSVKRLRCITYGGSALYFADFMDADEPANLGEIARICGLA